MGHNSSTKFIGDLGYVTVIRTAAGPASQDVTTADIYIVNQTVGAAFLLTLTNAYNGVVIAVKDGKGDAATNNITIQDTGGALIDGAATLVISVNRGAAYLVYDGAAWHSMAAASASVVAVNATTSVSSGTDATTTSTTAVLGTSGMTITPVAGTYFVVYSSDLTNSNNGNSSFITIFSGGVESTNSERQMTRTAAGQRYGISTQAVVTVNGAQAIEGRFRASAGTATIGVRKLTILRIA